MSTPTQRPVRHRRKVTGKRAVIGSAAALALTGGALLGTGLLAPAGAAPSGSAPAWPTAQGKPVPVPKTIEVSGVHDGKMQRYTGSGALGGGGQDESQDPLFKLKDGAVLKNVILGSPAADGVHCSGTCTLENVWWEDVGEDAATFKGTSPSATYTVKGGGARKASDKVLQFNGAGRLTVTGFQVSDFGKLVRTCGNCGKQYKRTVVISDVDITAPGKSIVGINENYGDTATLSKVRITGDSKKKIKVCTRFQGNNTGKEPKEIGSGPDGKHCLYKASDVTYK
ncbi:pectate lyase [Streptomyces lavendulocolor]|uniref:pectate lyase n=1 Tax=Streptomyces lavendulocolor TaxID=67316 RepID=UPI0033F835A4